jgi:hypothetical protein
MLVVFLRQRRFSWALLGKLALAALPYVLVAAGLMLYNYARFENPFEFGQAYQLTVADQTDYRFVPTADSLLRILNETLNNFFWRQNLVVKFPYVKASGVFANFPVLLLTAGAFLPPVSRELRKTKLGWLLAGLAVSVLAINVADIMWSPYLLERYRMDLYFLLAIGCFTVMGLWYHAVGEKARKTLNTLWMTAAAAVGVCAVLLCLDIMSSYYGDRIASLAKLLGVG